MTPENEVKTTDWGRAAVGGLMLLVGAALLIDRQLNFGGFMGYGLADFWPLLLIGMGIATLSSAETVRKQRHGLMLVLFGIWMLVASLGLWGFNYSNSWPLAVIAVGIATLLRPDRDSRHGGYWLIGTGLIFLTLQLGLGGLTWNTAWPLFVIMAGGSIIWRSLGDRREGTRKGDDNVRG